MISWLGGHLVDGTADLNPSDVVLAFTDGILESRDLAGDELGDDDLDTHLRTAAEAANDPAEVIAQVLATVRERADDLGRDDVTAGRPAPGPPTDREDPRTPPVARRPSRQTLPDGTDPPGRRGGSCPSRRICTVGGSTPGSRRTGGTTGRRRPRRRPGAAACEPCSTIRPSARTTIRSIAWTVLSRWAMTIVVRPFMASARAAWMCTSLSLSSAEVASSRTRRLASLSTARAIAIRWRWPPDSFTPRSPTVVSYPEGSREMNSSALAFTAASCTSSGVAPGRP